MLPRVSDMLSLFLSLLVFILTVFGLFHCPFVQLFNQRYLRSCKLLFIHNVHMFLLPDSDVCDIKITGIKAVVTNPLLQLVNKHAPVEGGGGHTTQLKPVLSGDGDIVSPFPAFPEEAIS